MSSDSLSSIQTPWKLTHCGGMGPHFEKCWITTPNSHPFWIIKCYCEKGGPIWKGKDNLSFLGEIVWSWHEQAFMNIMNVVYHNRLLHVNDLLKNNIMLDFSSNNLDVVYTSVCDWNDFEHLQKVTTFLYGFSKERDAINTRKACSKVAPKIFFVQDELRTMNFFWRMAKQH